MIYIWVSLKKGTPTPQDPIIYHQMSHENCIFGVPFSKKLICVSPNWLRFPGHTFPLNQLIGDLSFDFHQPTCLGNIEKNIYHLANSRDFDDVPAKNMQKQWPNQLVGSQAHLHLFRSLVGRHCGAILPDLLSNYMAETNICHRSKSFLTFPDCASLGFIQGSFRVYLALA